MTARLRHTRSLMTFADAPADDSEDDVENQELHPSPCHRPQPQQWKDLEPTSFKGVECGYCTISFEPSSPWLPSIAHLSVRVQRRARGVRHRRLWAAIEQALSADTDFVMTYDLRTHKQLGPGFLLDLVLVQREHIQQLMKRVKAVVFLVKENLFVAVAKRFLSDLGGLMKRYMSLCPFSICHSEFAASEFFRLCLEPRDPLREEEAFELEKSFVTLTQVIDLPDQNVGALSAPTSLAWFSPCSTEQTAPGSNGSSPSAGHLGEQLCSDDPSFFTLPNGDVMVIQNTPDGVVKKPLHEQVDGGFCEDKTDGQSRASGTSDHKEGGDAPAVFALKFACPVVFLQPCVGVHFHLGEIMADAEMESLSQKAVTAAVRASMFWSDGGCLPRLRR